MSIVEKVEVEGGEAAAPLPISSVAFILRPLVVRNSFLSPSTLDDDTMVTLDTGRRVEAKEGGATALGRLTVS